MITYSEAEKDGYSAGISPVTTNWWMKQLKGESIPSFIDLGEMISLWYHNTATLRHNKKERTEGLAQTP